MPGPYYVDSTKTGGGNTGADWTNAFVAFGSAVTAASTDADIIYVSHAHSESLSADTTYTFAANVRVLCVNSSTGALATSAVIGAQSTNYAITLTGAYKCYIYGIVWKNGTATAGAKDLFFVRGDPQHVEFENCQFILANNTGNDLFIGNAGATDNSYARLIGCVFSFGSTSSRVVLYTNVTMENCSVDSGGAAPATFIAYGQASPIFIATGCDFSKITGTLINIAGQSRFCAFLSNCKLGSGVTIKAAATVTTKGDMDVYAFNCDAGDNHYAMYHGDAFGETTVSNTIYANDGAAYDGSTSRCSWKIVTTANCNYYYPYVSPWMDAYHSGTSAISPYLEILRSGSTTKYQNDEVWGEFSYQGTSGSTKATIVNDRMTPLGTAADQTASSLDASGWTGEDASNNAYMVLAPTSAITPAEIGHLRARVCVGEPSITVYVDPTIRGRS